MQYVQYAKPLINTGDERSVTGHFVSGAICSAVVSASFNYQRYKKQQIDPCTITRESSKAFLQGGVATASAISATNKVGRGDYLGALFAAGLGFAAVYAVEKAYQPKKIQQESE